MTELENRALAFLQSHTLYDECRDEYYKDKSDFELLADFAKQEIVDLEKELKKWKDEWQEQVQKAIDEGYARTLQTMQLTKAKELLAKWVELYKPKSETALPTPIQVETEQFLNSELQSKWINPARTTNDNEIKLNSEVENDKNNKLSIWKNKKTGNIYVVLYDEAIECTNGREDIDYTVYTSINDVKDMNGKIFVRQTNEFYQKFERVDL